MIFKKRIVKKILCYFVSKKNTLIKVYSHPRSGTHFLEAFIAENFYKGLDLKIEKVTWGHWSNRKINDKGNPYGKLFGNHYFTEQIKDEKPKIYIVRDGRSVAYSIWKTDNFLHKELHGITFKDFLRTPIDWYGSPSIKSDVKYTIVEHWYRHVSSWLELEKQDKNVLVVYYEDIINTPYQVYLKIHQKFFLNSKKLSAEQIDPIKKPVGLLPNKAIKDSWKEVFDKEDLDYYFSIIPEKYTFYGEKK